MKKDKLTYIDLFSGCGGLSEGFNMSKKFQGLAHIEWEKPMVDTLRNRLIQKWGHSEIDAFKKVIHFDIQRTEELINGKWSRKSNIDFGSTNHDLVIKKGLRGIIGKKNVDVIIGGPPCQAYSIAGRAQDKNSMKGDYRNYLFESFVDVVKEFKPKIFVFENVPGILSACPGGKNVTTRIFESFEEIGYEIKKPIFLKNAIYAATDFGVPQKRNRVIIIGVMKSSNIALEDLYNNLDLYKNNNQVTSVFEAIGHLPKFKPLVSPIKKNRKNISHIPISKKYVKYQEPRFHNNRDIKIFKDWLRNKMNRASSLQKIAFYNDLMGKSSNHAKYRNIEWDKPSPTIVAHLHKDGLMFIHPDIKQARSITVKEAALLQSFPDDFEFICSQNFAYKMIGNAVPPQMAKQIALSIQKKFK